MFKSVASENEIVKIANQLKIELQPGDWVFLAGDLGAGKTTLIKSFVHLFDANIEVTSPTFSVMQSIPVNQASLKQVLHLDLYRLKKANELWYLGIEDSFLALNTIVFFEWAENILFEEWQEFFNKTHCPFPRRVCLLEITHQGASCREYKWEFDNNYFDMRLL